MDKSTAMTPMSLMGTSKPPVQPTDLVQPTQPVQPTERVQPMITIPLSSAEAKTEMALSESSYGDHGWRADDSENDDASSDNSRLDPKHLDPIELARVQSQIKELHENRDTTGL